MRNRALSAFDPTDATNRDRVSMLKSGVAMMRDHWLIGVGPNMVPVEYLAHYKRADAVDPADQPGSTRAHLHNVPMQLAAERGLPALAAWLVVRRHGGCATCCGRCVVGPAPALAAGGFAAVVAMFAAGLFEHNFGDSEFLILFLGLITLPYAARLTDAAGAGPPHDRCWPRCVVAALSGPDRRRHRRRDARSFRHRPGRSHLARSAGAGRAASIARTSGSAAPPTSRTTSTALGGRVAIVGLVGDDDVRRELATTARDARASAAPGSSSTAARPTTRKMRVVTTRNQQVARVDYEHDDELDGCGAASD